MFATALFAACSLGAVISALMVVTRRDPFASAISLVVCFFFVAVDFLLLHAPFVAVIQVLVYAGAIMVLFIFVIMLLNLRGDEGLRLGTLSRRAGVGVAVVVLPGLGILLAAMVQAARGATPVVLGDAFGSAEAVGMTLFGGGWILAFEAVSILLTVAVVGAVVLAKKDL